MSHWQTTLAIDLAKRCHAAGVRKHKDDIRKALFNLADQEEEFLAKHPEKIGTEIGYVKARDEYGSCGLGVVLNLALKYWPEQGNRESVQQGNRESSRPEPPSQSQEVLLEPIEIIFELQLDQAYDREQTASTLTSYLGARCRDTQVTSYGGAGMSTISLLCRTCDFISAVAEQLQNVSWITCVRSFPASLREVVL